MKPQVSRARAEGENCPRSATADGRLLYNLIGPQSAVEGHQGRDLVQARAMNIVLGRPYWRLGLVALITATLAVSAVPPLDRGAVAAEAPAEAAAALAPEGFAVQLGPEKRVAGPTDQGDNPYYSERRRGKLFGYFGTSRTIEWRSRSNTRLTKPRVILDRGAPGKFDECGAWLQGSFQKLTRRHWIAFYHAEGKGPGQDTCDHYGDTTVWRVAMAETTNGGRTWRRPNYPNNVVVTGAGATASRGLTNAGTPRVVKVGAYYYMFFKTAHGARPGPAGIHIARSRLSDGGLPGTWKKYYCHPATLTQPAYCAWDSNGIGGKSTPIGGISEKARYVVWNSALDRWIGFDASGKRGFRLYASPVGVGATPEVRQRTALFDSEDRPRPWEGSVDVYPLVSTEDDRFVDQWGGHIRSSRSKQLYAYPSIGGLEGQSCCSGISFYVYYVKLFPGDKFDKRYLFRRKVTLVKAAGLLNRVELTTYRNAKGQRRSSTEAPKSKSYRRVGATGYLLSHGAAGWKQVFDCSRRGDYALYVQRCRSGWKPYRRVGWIHPTRTAAATVPVYRCVAKRRHFASTSRGCGGFKREGRLGFALSSL